MLNDKTLPNDYRAEDVAIVVHILNISSTKVVRNITPYEVWFHRKPNVRYLKLFGCIA